MARGKICRRQWPRMEIYVVSNGCQILGFCSQIKGPRKRLVYMISFLKRRLDLHKIKIERRRFLGFLCFEATKAMVWEALRWLCDVVESDPRGSKASNYMMEVGLFCALRIFFDRNEFY